MSTRWASLPRLLACKNADQSGISIHPRRQIRGHHRCPGSWPTKTPTNQWAVHISANQSGVSIVAQALSLQKRRPIRDQYTSPTTNQGWASLSRLLACTNADQSGISKHLRQPISEQYTFPPTNQWAVQYRLYTVHLRRLIRSQHYNSTLVIFIPSC